MQTQERIEAEVEERIQQGRAQWKAAADMNLSEEIQAAVEKARREWDDCREENVQKIRDDMEESIQERIATEVCVCVKVVCSYDKDKISLYLQENDKDFFKCILEIRTLMINIYGYI